jgi:hypothetical protein
MICTKNRGKIEDIARSAKEVEDIKSGLPKQRACLLACRVLYPVYISMCIIIPTIGLLAGKG